MKKRHGRPESNRERRARAYLALKNAMWVSRTHALLYHVTPLDGLEFMPTASSSESTKKISASVGESRWSRREQHGAPARLRFVVAQRRRRRRQRTGFVSLRRIWDVLSICSSSNYRSHELSCRKSGIGASWCDGIDGRALLGPRIDVVELEALGSTRSLS